jgi:hypothetical protein
MVGVLPAVIQFGANVYTLWHVGKDGDSCLEPLLNRKSTGLNSAPRQAVLYSWL